MIVGAITRSGRSLVVYLDDHDTVLDIRLPEREAERLVSGILLNLAEGDPVRWTGVHDDVREILRSRLKPAAGPQPAG